MADLKELWRGRIAAILGIVRAGQTDHRELANISAQVGADYHGRFIVELIQNASDQAQAARFRESCVTIIRTPDVIAFANEGRPFNNKGLLSITSLGMSTKDPEVAIGNKGVGFKSVFQVSESPEIYSARTPTEPFADGQGLLFKLSLAPFAQPDIEAEIRSIVIEQLREMPVFYKSLTVDKVMSELKCAAPFKFPLPLSLGTLRARIDELPECPVGQTLVVLPLRQSPETTQTVDAAIDELFADAGAAILFLPSVSTIRVVDGARGFERTISRTLVSAGRKIDGFGRLSTVETAVQDEKGTDSRSWRLIRRKLGTSDAVSTSDALREAEEINREARKLPGENWDKVRTSPVEVAVPLQEQIAPGGSSLLGARGRVCIGLPTKDMTGTPAWISAHFHGTISRTGIDLFGTKYNARLFTECVKLHHALIADLKADTNAQIRRVATLAFERSPGPLASVLYAPEGQAKTEIILSVDAKTFQTSAETVLPESSDANELLSMVPHDELSEFGITLPDIELMREARPLLESLAGANRDATKLTALLLDRARKGFSVLEYSAQIHRGGGPAFWQGFLSWAVERFRVDQLSDQQILPVGKTGIVKPSEKVFLPPSPRRSSEAIAGVEGEIDEIPDELAQSLRFLDDTAVTVRKPDLRSLTELAAKLAPDTGTGLVRSPRLDHLINDAVGPLMQSLGADEASRQIGIALLRQAVRWLWTLSESGRERVTKDSLRVPVLCANGDWKWIAPRETYFGGGWLGDTVDSLLKEAYGDKAEQMLVPWEEFSDGFKIVDERDAWIGSLELLGVSRSPKLLRAHSQRPAPLESHDYSVLAIANLSCPIASAQPFWRSYLDLTRKRSARTTSGQKFDFRSVTWVDGLENDKSRSAVVKLMLLDPDPFEINAQTFLERQNKPNDDATTVPSLWVFAIMEQGWKIIPTQHGPARISDAWLIDEQHRGLTQRRLSLLDQVDPQYARAEKLLNSMGVTTLATATVSRLIYALGQVGADCADYNAETHAVALTLVEDLYSHLQVAFSKSPVEKLPDLESTWVPLERNGEVVGVRPESLIVAYFNDEPARADFIPGFGEAHIWPLNSRRPYRELIQELRRQLGPISVIRTSEARVDSGFQEDMRASRTPLLEWLSSRFPQHSVASDLACLIAYSGRETNPGGEDFKNTWRAFQQTTIAYGTFPAGVQRPPYFYDRTTKLLQVSMELSDVEKVEATWMLVSPTYRDTWAAYGRELTRGSPEKFLRDRHITALQRENAENAIGLSSSERFKNLHAVALAIWYEQFGTQPLRLFEEEWQANARSIRGICDWLQRSELEHILATTLGVTEEQAAVTTIQNGILTAEEWQDARVALGAERWQFSHKVKSWDYTMTGLVSILKTCVARAVSVDPSDVEPALQEALLTCPPGSVAWTIGEPDEVVSGAIKKMHEILEMYPSVTREGLVWRRLASIAEQAKETIDTVALEDAPNRDINVYRYDDNAKRSGDANARFDGLMIVAGALSNRLAEQIDVKEIRADSRISLLLNGWWANCFSILPAVQKILQSMAPKVAQRMSDERVFRDPGPANELLARFSELADQVGILPPVPQRKIQILGVEQTEDDAKSDLLCGTTGRIGQMLRALALLPSNQANLTPCNRAKVVLSTGKAKARKGHKGGGGQDTNRDRELAGQLGEAFVYESFRLVLEGFDEMAWRSCNRTKYGLEGEGDDSLGFDFSYRDIENQLTNRTDHPLCYIEVKATTGTGSEPFPMTFNEWERARESYESGDSVYVIVRVAHVRELPQITDVIIDPFSLYGSGEVAVVSRDMWFYVGSRRELDAESTQSAVSNGIV